MFYPFRNENVLKVNNSYCQELVEEGVLHTINENKRFFDPNCEKTSNASVRLFISDVDFSVDYDDYLTKKMKRHLCQKEYEHLDV